jgi:hypothetical protein
MRLTELEPEWIRWEDRYLTPEQAALEPVKKANASDPHTYVITVASLAEAQGLELDCPVCGRAKPALQAHRVQVAFRDRGVLAHHGSRNKAGKPTRWAVAGGSTFEDLRLSPSIDCTPSAPECWHGHIGLKIPGEVT